MKKLILFSIAIILIVPVSRLNAQKLISDSFVTGKTLAGNKVNLIYIPPPKEFFSKAGSKGKASITVYYTYLPQSVITAMEYATSILESVLPSDVDITVVAEWEPITTRGVLAQSSSNGYASGWGINAFNPWALYPAALAEHIAGQKLNGDLEGDINLYINSSVNWYYGTDGKPTSLKYDLVTVIIHELTHGLGFFDSFKVSGSVGSYGVGSVPMIYDTFIENAAGIKLTDTNTYKNPSSDLNAQLVSQNLYFNGPLLNFYTSGSRARLYAPPNFELGSSISHLDDDTTPDSIGLMRPFINYGEAIHNPGKFTMSMLGDLGWINTRIIHKSHKNTEEHLTQITINADIKSDTTYNHNKVGLVWSFDNFVSSDTIYMISPKLNNNYTANILIPYYNIKLDYYLFAVDRFLRTFRSPSLIDKFHYSVFIGTDTVKPVISHAPEVYYFNVVDSIRFDAVVTDNLGIDTVYVEYKVNEGPSEFIGLAADGKDGFSNIFPAGSLSLKGGDSLLYRIVAIDSAAVANQAILPKSGYFSVKIETIKPVADSYSTDFSDASDDFLNDGFGINKPAGFTSYGLNTPHPYVSPGENGDSIGYTAILRIPVKFDAYGMIISFMEIVLVEPGEEGSVFGTQDFYDYVIVEGSKNFGKTWFRLADGYDSRYITSWLTAYNSSILEHNSTYIGNESMLVKHTLFPKVSSDISAGDPLMVRFRLFSDPLANGWGWVIEDLHIGPLVNKVDDINYQPLVVYPNPGNGVIKIKQPDGPGIKPFKYSVFNSTGTLIYSGLADGGAETDINISGYSSGLYFIALYLDDGIRTVKYTLIR
jgi:hypothetical protein